MKILLCIVLYECPISQSDTLKCILDYMDHNKFKNEVCIHVYDNGKFDQNPKDIRYKYFPNFKNLYLSHNYNCALNYCNEHEIEWLILLDQDTKLSQEYLDVVFQRQLNTEMACYIPYIISPHKTIISPYFIGIGFRKKKITKIVKAKYLTRCYSINSATILNVKYFINNINIFSQNYPLDFLDHWYFHRFAQLNAKIGILPVQIEHALSVSNENVSLSRYKSILDAERIFFQKELSIIDRIVYKFIIIKRLISYKVKKKNDYVALLRSYLE